MSDLIHSLAEQLHPAAGVKSVFGGPITTQGKTVIPVARIFWGFGGGSGKGRRYAQPGEHQGEGEGCGGGVAAMPLGVFEVTQTATRFVPINEHRKAIAGFLLGLALGVVCARRRPKS